MAWSAIAAGITTQSGVYQTSGVVSAVNLTATVDTGTCTLASVPSTTIRDGHAFAIMRGGNVIAVRCAKSIATLSFTYYRLYLENGTEIPTDLQNGDTLDFFETTSESGGTLLGAVAGIVETDIGATTTIWREIYMGTAQALITGKFQVFNSDILTFGASTSGIGMNIGTGGCLAVGLYRTNGGYTDYSVGTVLRGTAQAGGTATPPFLNVGTATSRFNWFGGTIEAGGSINDVVNAISNIYSQRSCVFRSIGTLVYRLRCLSSSMTIYGLTSKNTSGVAYIGAPTTSNLAFSLCDMAVLPSNVPPLGAWLVNSNSNLIGGNNVDVAFQATRWMRIIDQQTGSNFIAGGVNVTASVINTGLTEVRQTVSFTLTDMAANPLTGTRIFCRDTNNGSRLAANVFSTNPDYTADRTYELTTTAGAGAITTDGGVLLAEVSQNPAVASVTRFASITWDYRGLTNTSADTFRFLFAQYGYKPDTVISTLKGVSAAVVSRALLADTNITQANPATVAAYATIDNLDQLYDYAAYWLASSGANMEKAGAGLLLINGSGAQLNLGSYNLVVNSAAASVFAVVGTTITIKSSALTMGTKFTSFTTSGTLTLTGATYNGGYTDSTGVHVVITVSGPVNGTRVQIYNVTDAAEVDNFLFNTSYSKTVLFTTNKTLRVRTAYQSGVTAKLPTEALGVLSASGASFAVAQVADSVYGTNAIDGSGVVGIAADYVNIQIDTSVGSGIDNLQTIYAWFVYNLTTANGIRNFFGALVASDTANYTIITAYAALQLENVIATPIKITGGYLSRDDLGTVIAATSNSIQMDPSKAYLANGAAILANTNLIPALL